MPNVCGDNRFEIIAEYKKQLIEGTNIESSPEEMAVIDSILFRFWQMGWIPAADVEPKQKWIKVKSIDDLPKRTMNCLVVCNEPGRAIERIVLYIDIHKAFFEDGNDITVYVTHWMPLPEPPKGEEDA